MMNFTTSYNPSSCTFKFRTDTGSWEDITSSITADGIAYPEFIYNNTCVTDKAEENKEENYKMNEVLKLYDERKKEEIRKRYNEMYQKEYKELEEVKRYKELVNTFEASMEELVQEFNKEDYKPFERTGYSNDYKFELSEDIMRKIKESHEVEFDKEYDAHRELIEEVEAQLSLSNDKDYQVEVLKRYEILDKKGILNI